MAPLDLTRGCCFFFFDPLRSHVCSTLRQSTPQRPSDYGLECLECQPPDSSRPSRLINQINQINQIHTHTAPPKSEYEMKCLLVKNWILHAPPTLSSLPRPQGPLGISPTTDPGLNSVLSRGRRIANSKKDRKRKRKRKRKRERKKRKNNRGVMDPLQHLSLVHLTSHPRGPSKSSDGSWNLQFVGSIFTVFFFCVRRGFGSYAPLPNSAHGMARSIILSWPILSGCAKTQRVWR